MTELDMYDMEIAAKTVWGEARGEPYEGKVAVARVIVNRWTHATDRTLEAICTKPAQFSCWNQGDPNNHPMRLATMDDRVLRECLKAVCEALNMKDADDPVMGARHYCAIGATPDWIQGRQPTVTIGRHHFYQGVQ